MIFVGFSIEEPLDRTLVEAVIQAVVEDCRIHLSHLTEVKGFIAVDDAADQILAILKK